MSHSILEYIHKNCFFTFIFPLEIKGYTIWRSQEAEVGINYKKVVGEQRYMLRLLAVTCLILFIILLPASGTRTYMVDDDGFANYKTIGEAISAASSGDTIYLKEGNYKGSVVVNKALTIMPLSGETSSPIINADGNETGMTIEADGCSIEGITVENFSLSGIEVKSNGNSIKNSKVINKMMEGQQAGIIVTGTDKNVIQNNGISSCFIGVLLWSGATENQAVANTLEGCNMSFFLRDTSLNNITSNLASNCGYGIYLMNSSKTSISKDSVSSCKYGVALENSSENLVTGCTIDNATNAIGLGTSSFNEVVGNVISNSTQQSLELVYSGNNKISKNQILNGDVGMMLVDSPGNTLESNELAEIKWGMYVDSSSREGFDNAIDESNTVDGNPIVYIYGQSEGKVADRKIAHLTLAYCKNFTLERNQITNDAIFIFSSDGNRIAENNISGCYGMRILSSGSNQVLKNKVIDNRFSGIFLVDSYQNQIEENFASGNNQNGISLFNSSSNLIRGNNVSRNRDTGLWLNYSNGNEIYENQISSNPMGMLLLYSYGNEIYHNNFQENKEQAEDRKGNNSWDMGNVTGGNYWSGYKAVGNPSSGWQKVIKGGKTDRYPFQDANGWTILPESSVQTSSPEQSQSEQGQASQSQNMSLPPAVANESAAEMPASSSASAEEQQTPSEAPATSSGTNESEQPSSNVTSSAAAPGAENNASQLDLSQYRNVLQAAANALSVNGTEQLVNGTEQLVNGTEQPVNQNQNESMTPTPTNQPIERQETISASESDEFNQSVQEDETLPPAQTLSANQPLPIGQSLQSNQSVFGNLSLIDNQSLPSNPSISNQSLINQSLINQSLINQSLINQSLINQSLINQSLINQSLINQSLINQSLINQSLINQSLINQSLINQSLINQSLLNQSLSNQSQLNQSLSNESVQSGLQPAVNQSLADQSSQLQSEEKSKAVDLNTTSGKRKIQQLSPLYQKKSSSA